MTAQITVLKVTKNGVFAPKRHIVTLFNSPKLLKWQGKQPNRSFQPNPRLGGASMQDTIFPKISTQNTPFGINKALYFPRNDKNT